jgi:hypothetical protein
MKLHDRIITLFLLSLLTCVLWHYFSREVILGRRFNRIQKGMSQSEVIRILGQPDQCLQPQTGSTELLYHFPKSGLRAGILYLKAHNQVDSIALPTDK